MKVNLTFFSKASSSANDERVAFGSSSLDGLCGQMWG